MPETFSFSHTAQSLGRLDIFLTGGQTVTVEARSQEQAESFARAPDWLRTMVGRFYIRGSYSFTEDDGRELAIPVQKIAAIVFTPATHAD